MDFVPFYYLEYFFLENVFFLHYFSYGKKTFYASLGKLSLSKFFQFTRKDRRLFFMNSCAANLFSNIKWMFLHWIVKRKFRSCRIMIPCQFL